jgi:hypothetical protein
LDDLANIMRQHYGTDVKTKTPERNIICGLCDTANELDAPTCLKCGSPLTLKVALEMEKEKNDDLRTMREQISQMQEQLAKIAVTRIKSA